MAFVHTDTIRFDQIDLAGILYFSRLFELCHQAMEAAMVAAGAPLHTVFEQPRVVTPVVHAEADYKAPLRLGDQVAVDVALTPGGRSSLTWSFEVWSADRAVLHATAKHVHVAVYPDSFETAPLTEYEPLEAYLELVGPQPHPD